MITQITGRITYTEVEKQHLKALRPYTKNIWESVDDEIKLIKSSIKNQLLALQNHTCAYCGLDLGGTSEGQIEHIAPKGKYPQFSFEIDNLAMACHHCNGWSKKGNHHTISSIDEVYANCAFKLVHPYYDDPSLHYQWTSNQFKILIQHQTPKGEYSIRILKLDAPRMAELRGKQVVANIVFQRQPVDTITDQLIEDVINFRV